MTQKLGYHGDKAKKTWRQGDLHDPLLLTHNGFGFLSVLFSQGCAHSFGHMIDTVPPFVFQLCHKPSLHKQHQGPCYHRALHGIKAHGLQQIVSIYARCTQPPLHLKIHHSISGNLSCVSFSIRQDLLEVCN